MAFVKGLRQRQRGFCRETETRVGFALQRRQVEQRGRHLRGGFGFLGYGARLFTAGGNNGLGRRFRPKAGVTLLSVLFVFNELRIEPATRIKPGRRNKRGMNLPVVARFEFANTPFALHDDGQRRGLNPADRRFEESTVFTVERRHGPGAVNAHQPVGFCA